jgi:hypothetical protein
VVVLEEQLQVPTLEAVGAAVVYVAALRLLGAVDRWNQL